MMTAFYRITKSTTEHLGVARLNLTPPPAKRHGFSPPFTVTPVSSTPSLCQRLLGNFRGWLDLRLTVGV